MTREHHLHNLSPLLSNLSCTGEALPYNASHKDLDYIHQSQWQYVRNETLSLQGSAGLFYNALLLVSNNISKCDREERPSLYLLPDRDKIFALVSQTVKGHSKRDIGKSWRGKNINPLCSANFHELIFNVLSGEIVEMGIPCLMSCYSIDSRLTSHCILSQLLCPHPLGYREGQKTRSSFLQSSFDSSCKVEDEALDLKLKGKV